MKSKYETLKSVVEYVKNESDDPVSELLMMGFTPCQLVFEFGFDEDEVRTSDVFDNFDDELDENEYPYILSKYNSFDAALVNWFKLSTDALLQLKEAGVYDDMKTRYEEEKIEALTEVTNGIFSDFEEAVFEELGDDYESFKLNEEENEDKSNTKTAKEKMVVFRCNYCKEDLKEYNPYINEKGESIALENIICFEVPDEICENTTFELTPILLNKENYRDLPDKEKELLLNRAIKNAIAGGYQIFIKVWGDAHARDEGLPYDIPLSEHMKEYIEDGCKPDELARFLFFGLDGYYNKYGCAEVVARKDEEEMVFYHQEVIDEYFLDDLFEFITGGEQK